MLAKMADTETAVNLPEALLAEAEAAARATDLHMSRPDLVALALKRFIRQQQARERRAQFNVAYADGPDAGELLRDELMIARQRQLLEHDGDSAG